MNQISNLFKNEMIKKKREFRNELKIYELKEKLLFFIRI